MNLWTPFTRSFRWITGRLSGLFRTEPQVPRRYSLVYANEVPEKVMPGILVAVGEGEHLWYAVLACPCGCGELIQLSLFSDERPRWRLTSDEGIPTLAPSVWRHRGCQSHFLLRNGVVRWCSEPSNLTPLQTKTITN